MALRFKTVDRDTLLILGTGYRSIIWSLKKVGTVTMQAERADQPSLFYRC